MSKARQKKRGLAFNITVADPDERIRTALVDYASKAGFHADGIRSGRALRDRISRQASDIYISAIELGDTSIFDILEENPEPPLVFVTVPFADPSPGIEAMKLGAHDYLTLPPNPVELHLTLQRASSFLRYKSESSEYQNIETMKGEVQALKRALGFLQNAYYTTLEALVAALDAREHETCNHSKRVSAYALHLAAQMKLSSEQLEDVSQGALLHDVGKIGVADAILLKPGPLSTIEWLEMMRHPAIGFQILKDIRQLRGVPEIVLSHQERYDGSGYPRMLAKADICLGARIFAVVDAFDAMTTDRPYRNATSIGNARSEIASQAGMQFDPDIVNTFMDIREDDWVVIKTTLG